jgi:glycosyltransferase involved in cell wall biosynthesis
MNSTRSKVLVSAFSFAPRQSSEAGIGWATVASIAKEYDVTVVAAGHYSELFTLLDFEDLKAKGVTVEFHEVSCWLWLRKLPNFTHGPRLYYKLWQYHVYDRFRNIVARDHSLFTHHVTWGAGTIYSRLMDLETPFIYGPVGGHETCTLVISWRFSFVAWVNEVIRQTLIRRCQKSKSMRRLAENAALIFAANSQTAAAFRSMGSKNVKILSNAGLDQERFASGQDDAIPPIPDERIGPQLLFVGRLRSWKGEEIALHAIARLKEIPWTLTIAGDGPNRRRCEQLCLKLGIENRVTFKGSTSSEQTLELFKNSDVFIFPSLHDSGGIVILEAMAYGLPVICLNKGGPGDMVTKECGIAVTIGDWDQTVDAIAEASKRLLLDAPLRRRMGQAGRLRCASLYDWRQREVTLLESIRKSISTNVPKHDVPALME